MEKIRFGIMSTAKIGREQVIPAMQKGEYCEIVALASRDLVHARKVADELIIPTAHGSYEDLLDDPDVDAVYIPLPNHMHVEWAKKALAAGKHVLCEKPVAMNADQAKELLAEATKHPELKVMEAFMYRHHPQWQKAKQVADSGEIGRIKAIEAFFSYYNVQPGNIRNKAEAGGGGLMDIGCYPVSLARFLFGANPERVCGLAEMDPAFGTDRMFSGLMDFTSRVCTFTCSTQLEPCQRVNMVGDKGRFEIEIPFNAPTDKPCRAAIFHDGQRRDLEFEVCDQYTIQGDLFARSILEDTPVPTPLSDAWENMVVLDALKKSAEKGGWTKVRV